MSEIDEMPSQIMGYYSERKEKLLKDFSRTSALIKASLVARYGVLYRIKADARSALEHLKNSLKHMEEGNVQHLLPGVFLDLGWGHYYSGELETARDHLQKGIKMLEGVGLSMFMSGYYIILSMVHFDSGDLESAQSCAEKAVNLAQENKEKHYEGISWMYLGRIIGKKEPKQMDEAEECILKGIKISGDLKAKPYVSIGCLYLGELYADKGQKEKAVENLNKAEKMFRKMGMDYWLAKTQEVLRKV